MGAAAIIALALDLLPKLVKTGMDISRVISIAKQANSDGKVDDADWKHLHELEDQLRAKLHSDTE